MLATSHLFSSFSVDDIDAARAFYGKTLGLTVGEGQQPGIIEVHAAGHDAVTVYPKPDHTPATFTVLNFVVDDMNATIDALVAAGITMEQYHTADMQTDARGVISGGGMRIAWFKDPAGNILSVIANGNA